MDSRVRVYFRPRPPEPGAADDIVVSGKTVSLRGGTTAYEFAGALQPSASQEDAYRMLCGDLLTVVKGGFDVAILFYGQTGTGKTHTATGTPDNEGVVPRAVTDILSARLSNLRVHVTAFQIGADESGRERVTDLLREGTEPPRMYMGAGSRSEVRPLHSVHVSSGVEARHVVEHANRGRAVRATNYNKQSSRSHAITAVHVRHGVDMVRNSTVFFCDLAGAERYEATDSAAGHREAIATNSALSALGQVVQAMAQGVEKPPFRRSQLTTALAGAFCTGVVRIMVHSRAGEPAATAATLNFGQSALSITTAPVPREHAENHAGLRAQLERMEGERTALEERLLRAERNLEESEAAGKRASAEAAAALELLRSAPPVTDSSESSELEPAAEPVVSNETEMKRILEGVDRLNASLFNAVQLSERYERENSDLRARVVSLTEELKRLRPSKKKA